MKLHLSPVLFRALMSLIAAAAPLAGAAHAASLTQGVVIKGDKVYSNLSEVDLKNYSVTGEKTRSGGAMEVSGSLTLSGCTGNFNISGNRVAYLPVDTVGNFVYYHDPHLQGGAIACGDLTISGSVAPLSVRGNSVQYVYTQRRQSGVLRPSWDAYGEARGGAIAANRVVFSDNGAISFQGNEVIAKGLFYNLNYGSGVTYIEYFGDITAGAAIYCTEADFSRNGRIEFVGNKLQGYGEGAAIYSEGGITFRANGDIEMSQNEGESLIQARGDVVFEHNDAVSLVGNATEYAIDTTGGIRFLENGVVVVGENGIKNNDSASYDSPAHGYLRAGGALAFQNNASLTLDVGKITASSVGIDRTQGDVVLDVWGGVEAAGGVTVSRTVGSVSLSGSYRSPVLLEKNKSLVRVKGDYDDVLTVSNNSEVLFEGKCAMNGVSLVDATSGCVTVEGNITSSDMTFRNNGSIFVSGTTSGCYVMEGTRGEIRFEGATSAAEISFIGNEGNIVFTSNEQALGKVCSFSGNKGEIRFEENRSSISAFVYNWQEGSKFVGNTSILFLRNQGVALNGGGFLFSENTGDIRIEENGGGISSRNEGSTGTSYGAIKFEKNGGDIRITGSTSSSGMKGGAYFIENHGAITLSNNKLNGIEARVRIGNDEYWGGMAEFAKNRGAIEVCGNGGDGIYSASSLFEENHGTMTFSANQGWGIHSSYRLTFSANEGQITVSDNGAYGVGIELNYGAVLFEDNSGGILISGNGNSGIQSPGDVTFSGNTRTVIENNEGSGIRSSSSVTMHGNREGMDIAGNGGYGIFSELSSVTLSDNEGLIRLVGNGNSGIWAHTGVTLSGNRDMVGVARNKGYGIRDDQSVTISSNRGDVIVLENAFAGVSAPRVVLRDNEGGILFQQNNVEASRNIGAIDGRSVELTGNGGDILFYGNAGKTVGAVSGSETVLISNNTGKVNFNSNLAENAEGGGAGALEGDFIAVTYNSGGVEFCGNMAKGSSSWYPGAILGTGNFRLFGNGDVLVENNMSRRGDSVIMKGLHFQRVGEEEKEIVIGATSGTRVTFGDSLYVGDGYAIYFNREITEGDVPYTPTGDIVFDGSGTAANLAQWKQELGLGAVTESELELSRMYQIYSPVSLYGGRLVVREAQYRGAGLAVRGAGTTLALQDAQVRHTGAKILVDSMSELHLQGVNTMAASMLGMYDKSAITLCVAEVNKKSPLLRLEGALVLQNALTLKIGAVDGTTLSGGEYRLLEVLGSNGLANLDSVTVQDLTGAGMDKSRLHWEGDTLFVTLGEVKLPTLTAGVWSNASGSGVWNAGDRNWAQEGKSLPYADGARLTFSDAAAGVVTLQGTLEPGSVTVDSRADYTWTGEGSMAGSGGLTKRGDGTLTIRTSNGYTGGTTLEAGVLEAGHVSALGAGRVTLEGGALRLGGLAVGNELRVTGRASLEGAGAYAGRLLLEGGELSGGTISLKREAELRSGVVSNVLTGAAGVRKTTAGTATLRGANSYRGMTVVGEGTLRLEGSVASSIMVSGGVLDTCGGLLLKSGQTLTLGGGSVRGHVGTSAGSELILLADAALEGGLTLGGGALTLDGARGTVSGALTLSGATTLRLEGFEEAGSYALLTFGSWSGDVSLLSVEGVSRRHELVVEGNRLTLRVLRDEAKDFVVEDATWVWREGAGAFQAGDGVAFRGNVSCRLEGEVRPSAVSVEGAGNVVWTGEGSMAGSGGLTKRGDGTLTIRTSNGYTGGTTLEAGVLEVAADGALGRGSVAVRGGVLRLGDFRLDDNSVRVSSSARLEARGALLRGLDVGLSGLKDGSGNVLFAGALKVTGSLASEGVELAGGALSGGSLQAEQATLRTGALDSEMLVKGNLTKVGSGNASLTRRTEVQGDVRVEAGSLTVGREASLAVGEGTVRVDAGASLRVLGEVRGGLEVARGGRVMMGLGKTLAASAPAVWRFNGGEFYGHMATSARSRLEVGRQGMRMQGNLTLGGGSFHVEAGATLRLQGALTLRSSTALTGDWNAGAVYTLVSCEGLNNVSGLSLNDFFRVDESVGLLSYADGALTLTTGAAVRGRLKARAAVDETPSEEVSEEGAGAVASAAESVADGEETREALVAVASAEEVWQELAESWRRVRCRALGEALAQSDWGVARMGQAFAETLRAGRQAGSAPVSERSRMWADVMGGYSRTEGEAGRMGAEFRYTGAVLGLETWLNEGACVGMAMGNAAGRVSPMGMPHLSQDAVLGGVYGTVRLGAAGASEFWFDGSVGAGTTETKSRVQDLPERWSQSHYQLDARFSWVGSSTEGVTWSGFAALRHYGVSAACEEGVSTGSLCRSRAFSGGGVSFARERWTLGAEASVFGEVVHHAPSPLVEGIRSRGAEPGRWGAQLRAGLGCALDDRWSAYADYSFEMQDKASSSQASVGVGCQF